MEHKEFVELPVLDQIIVLSGWGMDHDDPHTLKSIFGLINTVAMGATGDKPQEEVDKVIDIVFNGEK